MQFCSISRDSYEMYATPFRIGPAPPKVIFHTRNPSFLTKIGQFSVQTIDRRFFSPRDSYKMRQPPCASGLPDERAQNESNNQKRGLKMIERTKREGSECNHGPRDSARNVKMNPERWHKESRERAQNEFMNPERGLKINQ